MHSSFQPILPPLHAMPRIARRARKIARKAKWGPAFLPVPTSVVSLDPLLFQDAIIGLGAR